MKKLFNVLLGLLLITTLASCRPDSEVLKVVEYGDFICATNSALFDGEEGDISIIGLSEQGKQKEVLVFPNCIEGHRVVAFGSKIYFRTTDPIEITNAKKIYFCNLLVDRKHFYCCIKYANPKKYNFFAAGLGTEMQYLFDEALNENSNVYVDSYIYMEKYYDYMKQYYDLSVSTISYYVNEEVCYFVDYVINDKVEVIPPDPYIKGYEFEGWYEDLSYTKKWDFNNIINPLPREKDPEYEEYPEVDYLPVKVYAKWKKL